VDLPRGLDAGRAAPAVTLLDAEAQPVHLQDWWREAPLILVWYHLAFTGG